MFKKRICSLIFALSIFFLFSCDMGEDNTNPDIIAPMEVSYLDGEAGYEEVLLNWINPLDEDFDHIRISSTPYVQDAPFFIYNGETEKNITNLSNEITYTFIIKTIDSSGNISEGIEFQCTPRDNILPGDVTDLRITYENEMIILYWKDPEDLDFDSVEIWYGEDRNYLEKYLGHINSSGTTIGNLENGTTYTLLIRTKDKTGNYSNGIYTYKAKPLQILYSGNNSTAGNVPIDENMYLQGYTAEILNVSDSLKKTGYKFDCWNSSAYGSGTDYFPGDSIILDSTDITLYAQWKTLFSVTYDGNGHNHGYAPVDSSFYDTGEEIMVYGNIGYSYYSELEKDNYSFVGWNTEADGSGIDRNAETIFHMAEEDITLFARWEENEKYTVTYDGNNYTSGYLPIDENEYFEGESAIILDQGEILRNHFVFKEWNTEEDGTGESFTSGNLLPLGTKDIVLYAQWTPIYNITYNGNENTGGAVHIDEKNYFEGDSLTLSGRGDLEKKQDEITLDFLGWNTEQDGSGVTYDEGEIFNFQTSDITLFAKWSPVIGCIGPAGGVIFYDDEEDGIDDIPNYRYLESAVNDDDGIVGGYTYDWRTIEIPGAYGAALGDGISNTEAVIAKLGPVGSHPAQIAYNYEKNGFNDWFLPSVGDFIELNTAYIWLCENNLLKRGMAGVRHYWTSTEYSATSNYVANRASMFIDYVYEPELGINKYYIEGNITYYVKDKSEISFIMDNTNTSYIMKALFVRAF